MTDDDKALVERLRADDLCDLELAPIVADRIEALSAGNERLREALQNVAHDFVAAAILCREGQHTARAALGDTK